MDESWKLNARARHQLESYVSELPEYDGDADQRGLSQVAWAAMRPGANLPLRPSVAVWQLSGPSTYWGPRASKASSNRPSRVYGLRYVCCVSGGVS